MGASVQREFFGCCTSREADKRKNDSLSLLKLQGKAKWVELEGLVQNEIDKVFEELDLDQSNTLDATELAAANEKIASMGCPATLELEQFGNRAIGIVEFRIAVREQARKRMDVLHAFVMRSKEFQGSIEKIWKQVDVDGNGNIDKDELTALTTELAERMGAQLPSEDTILNLLKRYDKDASGTIEWDEFQALVEDLFKEVLLIGRARGKRRHALY
eukprot:TRINITY_DN29757_c0_g1_i1.p1 TRINITY_DN29757_c0_g1~~TRINITY_DN29757_c0_g1_i1.p1  ORF type:complete len:216 (+),score=42.81 TRINITY_DN29757_c0_g1_i1:107-754(+)